MPNITAHPPPQLSEDGRWRWDGTQWVPVRSSKRSGLPGPGAPQLSSDGRWWWNGYEWVPATPASSKSPKPPGGPGVLAILAASFGGWALLFTFGPFFDEPPLVGDYDVMGHARDVLGVPSVLWAPAVLALVFGVLALVFPGHGHNRGLRRFLAWGGIAISLAFAAYVAVLLSVVP